MSRKFPISLTQQDNEALNSKVQVWFESSYKERVNGGSRLTETAYICVKGMIICVKVLTYTKLIK